jgi:hypothetical protein
MVIVTKVFGERDENLVKVHDLPVGVSLWAQRTLLPILPWSRLYPPAAGCHTINGSRHKHTHTQSRGGSRYYEAPEVLIVNGEPVPAEPVDEQASIHRDKRTETPPAWSRTKR